ncbi:MAG: FAD-dependent thymidylate synthase [Lachnospiraceae bacterium]|nr:FAD-dependent thymidylate synthase [Lachnospiraceae bacterium]
MLEHASFIVETSVEFYEQTKDVIESLAETDGFISFLRFTDDRRPIISGNVRAWRDFFKAVLHKNNTLPGTVKTFIKSNSILFPEFQDSEFTKNCICDFKILSVFDLQTTNEKLTHWDVTVKFVTDRGISHEIVRHRIASFAQESTRYCNYSQDKFGNELTFIIPDFLKYGSEGFKLWKEEMKQIEKTYFAMLDAGHTAQEARSVLPNALKTELIMTANLRECRHFFKLRAANSTGAAHPQMLEITRPLLDDLKAMIPVVFDDIIYKKEGEEDGKQ